MNPIPVTLTGLGLGLPDDVVTNEQLALSLDTSDDWITARTGIRTRRILEPEKALSDLATEAGRRALEASGLKAEQIGLVIVATVTPDTFMPATACRVANALGCSEPAAFDLNVACSGFLYGLLTAISQMKSQGIEYALLIGGDTISRILDWEDRRTAVLFGDSAGAAILKNSGPGALLGFDFGADGVAGGSLSIKAGPSCPSQDPKDYKVSMNGRAVFRFAANILVESSQRALQKAGLEVGEIDLVIPHQANLRIIESAAKRWKLPMDRFFVNLDRYGNTSAGSVPVALAEAVAEGRVKPGDKILLTAFGGGLSWASVVLLWG